MSDEDLAKTWQEEDEAAWEERGEFGDTVKQATLINKTFRLDSVRLLEYDWEGKQKETYIGTIALNGEEETVEAWLGGRFVMDRIESLVKNEQLPMFLLLIRDADKKGQPYRLLPGGSVLPEDETPPPAPREDSQSSHPHLDTLVKFCQDNDLARENGSVNAALVLELLDITVPSDKPPSEAFTAYRDALKKELKIDIEDDVYEPILGNIVVALAKKKGKGTRAASKPESEPIPFE